MHFAIGSCQLNTYADEKDVDEAVKRFIIIRKLDSNFPLQQALMVLQQIPEIGKYISMVAKIIPRKDEIKEKMDKSIQEIEVRQLQQFSEGIKEAYEQIAVISDPLQKQFALISIHLNCVILKKLFRLITDYVDVFHVFIKFAIIHISILKELKTMIPTLDNKQLYKTQTEIYRGILEEFFDSVIKDRIRCISGQKVKGFTLFPFYHPIYCYEDSSKGEWSYQFVLFCSGYCPQNCEDQWLENRNWYAKQVESKIREMIHTEYLQYFELNEENYQ